MGPPLALADLGDDDQADMKIGSDGTKFFASRPAASDCMNIVVCQPRHGILATTAVGFSSLGYFVCHVVGLRSEEKMRRVDAARVVATVQHEQASRDGANQFCVGYSVSGMALVSEADVSVSVREFCPLPLNTAGWGLSCPKDKTVEKW